MNKKLTTKRLHRVLALVLTIAALIVGQGSAWAQSTWMVTNDDDVFTIKRSSSTTEETICYRTASLSARAFKNFVNAFNKVTFKKGETRKNVEISYKTVLDALDWPYDYQEGTTRTYRFEVLDEACRTILASTTKDINCDYLSQVKGDYITKAVQNLVYFNEGNFSSSMPSGKYYDMYLTTSSDYYKVTDKGYNKQEKYMFKVSDFVDKVSQASFYLDNIGAKLYATVCFTMKEENDGYQYIQITENKVDDDDPNGKVNDPDNSLYKACFELSKSSPKIVTTDHKQFFPHRLDVKDAKNDRYEFEYSDSYLYQQKFKDGCRAPQSGSLMLNPKTDNLYVCFDAAGDDNDTWYFKDLFVRLALGDDNAPTLIGSPLITSGYHYRGSSETITLAFNEIIKVQGTPTISTTWGTFTYEAGDGSNILSFSGTIDALPGTAFRITKLNGTVKDMAGNAFTWQGTQELPVSVGDRDDLSDYFQIDEEGHALISSKEDLATLAYFTASGSYRTTGRTFVQTADIVCDENYTSIGNDYSYHCFNGIYDGQGYTISGIVTGLFAYIGEDGIVKNVVINHCTFKKSVDSNFGCIVGNLNNGKVLNCRIGNTVSFKIESVNNITMGGVVGYNSEGEVEGCVCAASPNVQSATLVGGIVGLNLGIVKNCLYTGATDITSKQFGAIVGRNKGSMINNFYTCTPQNVGEDGSDKSGARFAYTITLDTNVDINGTPIVYDVSGLTAINDNMLRYGNKAYSSEGVQVTLNVPSGFEVVFMVNKVPISGNTFTMPKGDVTVSATMTPINYTITYKLKYGTNDAGNPATYTVNSSDIILAAPTDEVYTFFGWYTNSALTISAKEPQIPSGSTGNRTFYAKWNDINLYNDDLNTRTIKSVVNNGKAYVVCIKQRTLYKDGKWNTLCLPFTMTAEQVTTQLAPSGLKTLNSSTLNGSTLTLNFTDATTIEAGKPYIIKWDGDGTNNLVNPLFRDVYITNISTSNITTEYVKFIGTFSSTTFDANTRTVLYLGSDNKLYYPNADMPFGAFRGYFQLKGITAGDVSQACMYFGDETTSLSPVPSPSREGGSQCWCTIDGRRLSSKPTTKGVYINGGRKVVVK